MPIRISGETVPRRSIMKNHSDVLIDGKVYTVCGSESEEYFQQVASYIDHKIAECEKTDDYRYQDARTRSVLLALNIADDFYKAQNRIEALEKEVLERDEQIYKIKHDLISFQMQCEDAKKNVSASETDPKTREEK